MEFELVWKKSFVKWVSVYKSGISSPEQEHPDLILGTILIICVHNKRDAVPTIYEHQLMSLRAM